MAQPWKTLASLATDEGLLELRQRGPRDFLIVVGGLVLMNSLANRSEIVLGQLGCRHLHAHPAPRVLVGGLGMGFTLRAVLDELPASAAVTVAELNPSSVAMVLRAIGPAVPMSRRMAARFTSRVKPVLAVRKVDGRLRP